MRKEIGMNPNEVTLISVLPVCADIQALNEGKCAHVYAVKMGFLSETKVINSLISVYGKFGVVDASCRLFEAMELRNIVSWNSMIVVYVQNGFSEALGDLVVVRPGKAMAILCVLDSMDGSSSVWSWLPDGIRPDKLLYDKLRSLKAVNTKKL
ncbi:hypothetical protein IFM89_031675 [Coptis chinensis]|uniref:Pentatricopeptide repeat-containing protein n=1 Tax=Coptis chinensis TaxID=261450 RepID=A0A835LPN7_9MAGN|nr:hypothetical protein IFM89_031675 [Coptis chinensis]